MATFNQEVIGAVALNTQAISSNTTTVGAIVDTQGYEAADILILSGTLTDGAYALVIEEGDDAGLSDAAAVDAKYLDAALSTMSFADTDDNAIKSIGYVGKKRYVRISIVSTGVTTGGTLSGLVVFGRPRKA